MRVDDLQVAVVGAGIGGLGAALALVASGARVTVYEQAQALGEVGQGLGLFANAVRALDALGVGEAVRNEGWRIEASDTVDTHGRSLLRIDTADHERRTGTPSLLIRRPDLHRLLLAALPSDAVRIDAGVEEVTPATDFERGELRLTSGERVKADLIIGADGWRSRVRESLWGPGPERNSGLICWRGMASGVRLDLLHALPVMQGAGLQFGIGPLGPDSAYWFASYPATMDDGGLDPEPAKARLLGLFADFPLGTARIIQETPETALLRTPLFDRAPLKRWSKGGVTLLGDAAHPMVPTLGQGAATALEDAVVMAAVLKRSETVSAGLQAYEAERIPRTTRIVNAAWRLARVSLWINPTAVALRNASLRLTPAAALRGPIEEQLGYDARRAGIR